MNWDPEGSSSPCPELVDIPNRGPLRLSLRQIILHPLHFSRAASCILTAHHPVCEYFDEHVFEFRGRKWCLGCTFNTISFLSFMLGYLVLWVFDDSLLVGRYLFWSGIMGLILYFPITMATSAYRKRLKIASKFLLGGSFASVSWSILLVDGLLSSNFPLKAAFIIFLYLCVITLLNAKRVYELESICTGCDYKMRWSQCPGMRELVCRLAASGFIKAELIEKSDSPE